MKPLTPQRYEQVRSIFAQVCDMQPLERSAVLDEKCADDPDLRDEIESLLKEEFSDELLRESRLNLGPRFFDDDLDSFQLDLPCSIGRYQLTSMIGQGGMGTVFEATQENPERTVAVKVIRPGLLSAPMLRRFAHEAHVLARLQHQGIAQIFEAGTARINSGEQPYFAMEYIKGEPLLEYANARALVVRARLELLARVADAVHHAHTKGVIHRDLKPSNILVVNANHGDRIGQPKILDFGVARAADPELQSATLNTNIGQLVGTIPYMSPEQASGDSNLIDTRSDVFALGVIAFELLTAELPYRFDRAKPYEVLELIRQHEPARLGVIKRGLRGDVETIVAKALERDRERRYQSAADLAADIRRYLDDQPIIARPPSAAYQFKKFAKRNKVLVAGVSIVMLLLIAGIAGTTYGMRMAVDQKNRAQSAEGLANKRLAEATAARDDANSEVARSASVLLFLTSILSSADPYRARARELSVRELLDEASQRAEHELQQQPEILATISETLGKTYFRLGLYDEAEPHLRRALELFMKTEGDESIRTASAMIALAELLSKTALHAAEVEPLMLKAVAIYRSGLGDRHADTLEAMNGLAICIGLQGRNAEAEELYRDVLANRTAVLGADHEQTIQSMNNLGSFYSRVGRIDDAEELLRAALVAGTRLFGEEERQCLIYAKNLALALKDKGNLDEAELLIRRVVDARERILGPDHPESLQASKTLIEILMAKGDIERASELGARLLDNTQMRFGDRDQAMISTLAMVAVIFQQQGKFDDAERLFREVLDARQEMSGDSDPNTLAAMNNLANVLVSKKEFGEAAQLLRNAFETAQISFPQGSWQPSQFQANYGACLSKAGRFEEAESQLLKAFQDLQSILGDGHARTLKAAKALADLYDRWGKPDIAQAYLQMLSESEQPFR